MKENNDENNVEKDKIILEEQDDKSLEGDTKINTSKKGLIILAISIILIIIALIIILYFVFENNVDAQNYIIAKFLIKNINEYNPIFYRTFIDSIEKMVVNDSEVNIASNITFDKIGIVEVELKFNKKLKNLDNLFYNCHSLEEVDLSFLLSEEVTSASDMFHGCRNLKKIYFGKLRIFIIYQICFQAVKN